MYSNVVFMVKKTSKNQKIAFISVRDFTKVRVTKTLITINSLYTALVVEGLDTMKGVNSGEASAHLRRSN